MAKKKNKKNQKNRMILIGVAILLLFSVIFFANRQTAFNEKGFSLLSEFKDNKIKYKSGEIIDINSQVTWYTGGWNPAFIGYKTYYQLDDGAFVLLEDRTSYRYDSNGVKVLGTGEGKTLTLTDLDYQITTPNEKGSHKVDIYFFVHDPHDDMFYVVNNWNSCNPSTIDQISKCPQVITLKKTLNFEVEEEQQPNEDPVEEEQPPVIEDQPDFPSDDIPEEVPSDDDNTPGESDFKIPLYISIGLGVLLLIALVLRNRRKR